MNYCKFVTDNFNEWVSLNKHNYPSGMLEGLMRHERFNSFVDNMTQELKIIAGNVKVNHKVPPHIARQALKDTVYDMAKYFADLAKRHRDEYYMSEIDKAAAIAANKTRSEKVADIKQELADDGIIVEDA